MDPRVTSSQQDLAKQFHLEEKIADGLRQASQAAREIHEARVAGSISADLEKQLAGGGGRRGEEEDASGADRRITLGQLRSTFAQLLSVVDSADAAPTTQVSAAAEHSFHQLDELLKEWTAMKK